MASAYMIGFMFDGLKVATKAKMQQYRKLDASVQDEAVINNNLRAIQKSKEGDEEENPVTADDIYLSKVDAM